MDGTKVQALLDSGAIANLLSHKLVQHLASETNESPKKMTVANGEGTNTLGAVSGLMVYFEDIQVPLDILVIDSPPLMWSLGFLHCSRSKLVLTSEHKQSG